MRTEALGAASLATRLLDQDGARMHHSVTVATRASSAAGLLAKPWRSAVIEAAWLHDIGYSEHVAETDFHPLDGARWLRRQGWRSEVCRLVAWHTGAAREASMRGLDDTLSAEFDEPPALPAAVLAWADLTTSATGETCTIRERIDDIFARYPAGSVVHEAIAAAETELLRTAKQVERLLENHAAAV